MENKLKNIQTFEQYSNENLEKSDNKNKILKDIPDEILNKIEKLFIKLTNGEISDKEYIKSIKEINK